MIYLINYNFDDDESIEENESQTNIINNENNSDSLSSQINTVNSENDFEK